MHAEKDARDAEKTRHMTYFLPLARSPNRRRR